MRRQVLELPNGVWSHTVELDYDGINPDLRPRVAVSATIVEDTIRLGFEGSSRATEGPINLPSVGTRATLRAALKALVAPLDRTNDGHFAMIEFDLPPGLIVSPERPSPSDCYLYVAACAQEALYRALAEVLPDQCPAGGLQATGLFFFRTDPTKGKPFIWVDPMTGGNGAHANGDGPTLMMFSNGDVPNTPVEVAETRFPAIRVERSSLRPEAAGAGCRRGGMGVTRDYFVREPGVMITTVTENTRKPLGEGVFGGETGAAAEIVITSEDTPAYIRERVTQFPLPAGTRVSVRSPGGGGWGNPRERDPAAVASDVRNELLTREHAESVYSVTLTPHGDVDIAATEALRREATPAENA
jgi:N-methylhydantoinase B